MGYLLRVTLSFRILLTNVRDAQALTDASAVMTAHRPLPFAMHSNDDIDWPVHSLMLSFNDLRGLPLRRLPSTALCSFQPTLNKLLPKQGKQSVVCSDVSQHDTQKLSRRPVPLLCAVFLNTVLLSGTRSLSSCAWDLNQSPPSTPLPRIHPPGQCTHAHDAPFGHNAQRHKTNSRTFSAQNEI